MSDGMFEGPAPAGFAADEDMRWTIPLPEDRAEGRVALTRLVAAIGDFNEEADLHDPAIASHVGENAYGERAAGRLLDALGVADATLEELSSIRERLDGEDAPVSPDSVDAMRVFVSGLEQLVTRHDEAGLATTIEAFDDSQIETFMNEVAHRDGLYASFAESATWTEPRDKERRSAVRAAVAAVAELRDGFQAETIEDGKDRLKDLIEGETEMNGRVRRLSAVATRLDAPDASLGDLARVIAAAARAGVEGADRLRLIADLKDDSAATISAAAARARKILHAGDLLDRQFGAAWRTAELGRLELAVQILAAPQDGRRRSVLAFADGIGVQKTPLESLTAIIKTRKAMKAFGNDETLKRTFPAAFSGLETDFDDLDRALVVRAEIQSMMRDCPLKTPFMVALATRSDELRRSLVGFAALEGDVAGLDLPEETRLRDVRIIHEERKDRVRGLLSQIEALPVADECATAAEARRLGRLLKEVEAAEDRLAADPVRQSNPNRRIENIVAAIEWKAALARLLPLSAMPTTDVASATLLITVRRAREALTRWKVSQSEVRGLLGDAALSVEGGPLTDARSAVAQALEAHELIDRRYRSLAGLNRAGEAGLNPFLQLAVDQDWPRESWTLRLEEAFIDVDTQMLEAAIANELLAAASVAEDVAVTEADGEDQQSPVGVDQDAIASLDAPAMWVEEVVTADAGFRAEREAA